MKARKHQLLATSALATAAMALPGVAAAEMMKPALSVGGYYYFDTHIADVDGAATESAFMEHDLEVHFNGLGELDNGLKVGARIELEGPGAGNDRIDDHWISLESGWGRIDLGATDGVSNKTMVTAPSAGFGITSGVQTEWLLPNTKAWTSCAFRCALGGARLDAGNDDSGVHYFSPRFNGFQFAVGYRPEATGSGSKNQKAIDETTDQNNAMDAALNYAGEMGGMDIKASVGYGAASAASVVVTPTASRNPDGTVVTEKGAIKTTPTRAPNPSGDYRHVTGGLKIGIMGFTVGGHYAKESTDGPHKGASYGLGATYGQGPWLVGVSIHDGSVEGTPAAGDHEYEGWSVGGQYTVGPGLRLLGGYQSVELDLDSAPAVEGSAFTLGVAVNF